MLLSNRITLFPQLFVLHMIVMSGFAMLISACSASHEKTQEAIDSIFFVQRTLEKKEERPLVFVRIPRDIKMKNYFSFLDSVVADYDNQPVKLTEYAIVHSNPWVLDSLRDADYYVQKKKGFFLFDQAEKVMLHKDDSLVIPDSAAVARIDQKLKSTIIDLNIPEYTLRMIQLGDTILISKVRIGRNAEEFLPVAGRVVDLRTPIGQGEIIRIERMPVYVNPDSGDRFEVTTRDDGKVTKMPVIPWLEPIINDVRYGTMIHPTTNPRSLGKSYSHGCVGTTEADAWTIYYNSPIGTRVVFRYDLAIRGPHGDTIHLNDIYRIKKSGYPRLR